MCYLIVKVVDLRKRCHETDCFSPFVRTVSTTNREIFMITSPPQVSSDHSLFSAMELATSLTPAQVTAATTSGGGNGRLKSVTADLECSRSDLHERPRQHLQSDASRDRTEDIAREEIVQQTHAKQQEAAAKLVADAAQEGEQAASERYEQALAGAQGEIDEIRMISEEAVRRAEEEAEGAIREAKNNEMVAVSATDTAEAALEEMVVMVQEAKERHAEEVEVFEREGRVLRENLTGLRRQLVDMRVCAREGSRQIDGGDGRRMHLRGTAHA